MSFLNNENETKYNKGSIIFSEGEECFKIGYIKEGQVRISLLVNNHEYEIGLLNAGDYIGDTLLFSKENTYLGDAIATKETIISFYSKQEFLSMLKKDNLLESFLEYTANKTLNIKNKLKLYSITNLRERIIFYLEEQSKIQKSNIIKIHSKESLAIILNVPRPSLSRELIRMQKENIISFNRKTITLMI